MMLIVVSGKLEAFNQRRQSNIAFQHGVNVIKKKSFLMMLT